ncbi:magnesium transporter [Asinibacterium sp. OR53]|uniref:magnesium transporter n=1 Tax=Asinibacterium sp. OR53 TaxID=925409 RepID=UPI0004B78028|nr:magnesium transporter [Asinibacterium sp. OR53]
MNHFNTIRSCIRNSNDAQLKKELEHMKFGEVLSILNKLQDQDQAKVFDALNEYTAIKAFKVLSFKTRQDLIRGMHHEKAARLLNAIPDDDRTAFLEELPSRTVNELIKLLSPAERSITLQLLGYKEGTVGRLMTPHYVAVKKDWTVQQVFDFIKLHGQNSETVNVIYVVDDNGVLIDDIRIREFLFVEPSKKVSEVMDNKFLNLVVTDRQKDVIEIFQKNNRFALPVTDEKGVLIGIVTIDDVLRLAETENTREIQKIGGSEALDEPYTQISFVNLIKKRAGWLIILFLGEMLTATAMGHFEGEISRAVVLSLFIPLIISSGGNSGSQASSIIIRAMALGEVKFSSWWYVMRKEIVSGLTLGIILGIVGFLRIFLWQSFHFYNYGQHWLLIATTVAFALLGVVLWGTLAGSMLPLALKRVGADPAASSAPFVATLVDVTGLIIYFSVAFLIMHGTLL